MKKYGKEHKERNTKQEEHLLVRTQGLLGVHTHVSTSNVHLPAFRLLQTTLPTHPLSPHGLQLQLHGVYTCIHGVCKATVEATVEATVKTTNYVGLLRTVAGNDLKIS